MKTSIPVESRRSQLVRHQSAAETITPSVWPKFKHKQVRAMTGSAFGAVLLSMLENSHAPILNATCFCGLVLSAEILPWISLTVGFQDSAAPLIHTIRSGARPQEEKLRGHAPKLERHRDFTSRQDGSQAPIRPRALQGKLLH